MENKKRKVDELDGSENGTKQYDLVYKTSYYLNKSKSKSIEIGLEAENYDVGVKLISAKGAVIYLTKLEWDIIVNSKDAIEKYFEINNNQGIFIPIFTSYGMAIETSSFDGIRLIKISKDDGQIYFGKASWIYLFRLVQLIQTRMINLKNLKFKNFFNETLVSCIQLGGDILENIRYIVRPGDMNFSSENAYCMNEILSVQPNIITDAVNKMFY